MASETDEAICGNGQPSETPSSISSHKKTQKNIDLPRKKLVSLETQRIVGVLDECIRLMELVALLPSEVSHPESLSLSLRAELTRALTEDLRLEKEYQTLSLDPGAKGQEAAAKAVQNSLLNISRLLRACPSAEVGLQRTGPLKEDRKGVQEMLECLRDNRSVLLKRLFVTPMEERVRIQRMQEDTLRHNSNQEVLATLEKEAAAAVQDRDKEISRMSKIIQWLRSSIHKTEKSSEDFVVRKQKEAERQNESVQKTSELKQTRFQEEVNQLKVQLKNLIIQHREAELALRKKSYKVETEVQNWIQKYDAEMGEKQTELEEITQIHEEEMAELSELQEYYALRELEYSKIMEEHRIEQERRDEVEREREVQSHAAIIIQAFWRGWCIRKAMKAKTKGQKNKKGKGKGKGKKGK